MQCRLYRLVAHGANPTVKTILDELRPGATYTVGATSFW